MNVLIISSSREDIDSYYKCVARDVSKFLAKAGCDLVSGAASSSMMGICYEEFVKNNRNVYSFTTKKYIDDLKKLDKSKHYIRETTFDLKKDMFFNSDFVVCLPGGVGTVSELLTYIEEKRSNDSDKPIIVYDENNFYGKIIELLKELVNEGFASEDIFDMFKVIKNPNEFKNEYYKIEYNNLNKGRVK